MGNCLSSSNHVRVRGEGGGHQEDATPHKMLQHQGDNTESTVLDTQEIDITVDTTPISPEKTPAADATTASITPILVATSSTSPDISSTESVEVVSPTSVNNGGNGMASMSMVAPHKRTDDSPGTEQPAVVFSMSDDSQPSYRRNGNTNTSVQSFSLATGHTRQGRALQARLQKARHMQNVLNSPNAPNSAGGNRRHYYASSNKSPASTRSLESDTGSFSSIPEDDEDYTGNHLPMRYSMSSTGLEGTTPRGGHRRSHSSRSVGSTRSVGSHRSVGSARSVGSRNGGSALNDEFEANIQKGMVWAEVEREHAVLAVALSRQKPTLMRSTPPLFLAVGTEQGTVSVTELLDDSSPLMTTSSSSARLGTTVSIHRPHAGRIRSLDFSPDGSHLALAGDDGICALCRLDFAEETSLTHVEVVAEVPRVDRIYAVQYSPNGQYLAIGGFDGKVAIVSTTTTTTTSTRSSTTERPTMIAEIPCDGLVLCLDWSPDGQYLAIGMTNKTCVLVDCTTRDWQVFYTIRRPASVQTVQWHPLHGGRYLAIGSNNVVIIDRETFAVKHELDIRSSGNDRDDHNHKQPRLSLSSISPSSSSGAASSPRSVFRVNTVCWSPNGSFLVANGSDDTCKLLETKTYTAIHEIRGRTGITSVVWGQQNVIAGIPHRYLAMGGEDKKVVILKAGLEVINGNSSMGDDISSAASSYFSNRGDWVLKENAFRDVDEIQVHHGPEGKTAATNGGRATPRQSGGQMIHAICFSRGSRSRPSAFFAVATGDGVVTIRSTLGWKIISQVEFLNPTLCMAFSNGSRLLALGGEDGKVRLVATAPLWSVIAEVTFEARINSLAFSKNNERIAVGSGDGILSFVCPQDNFRVVGEITENGSNILTIDWSSKNLAVGREDGVVHVHDSENIFHGRQKPSAVLECRKAVRSVAFGASSRFLVTGGDDGMIRVYSARGGWVLVHQISAGFGISTIKWSPSGRHLAYTGKSNQFQVVDTIFWAEVGEANAAVPAASKTTAANASSLATRLSFSQDGKMIAFSSSQSGTRIINTVSWDVLLSLTQPSPSVVSEASSSSTRSISSPDTGLLGSGSD